MSRVVVPDVVIVPISDGDTITVKKRLNAGDERRMVKRAMNYGDGQRHLDPIEAGLAKILAYLLDWTLRDDAGRTIPIRDQPSAVMEAALDIIDPDSYAEILRAIEAHEVAMQDERDAQKKIRRGVTPSSATLPSRDAADGATNGLPVLMPTSTES